MIALIGAGLGYLRTWPPVATVMSGSMSPAIETGDIVVMGKLQRPPRAGDVIAVTVPDAARSRYGYPPKVIHRIVRVAPNGQITTKGDARKKPDPFTVSRSSVETGVVFTVPAAGRVLAFLGSTLGLIWLAAGALLLVVLPLLDRQRETAARGREEMESLRGDVELLRSDIQAVLEEVVRAQGGARSDARDELEERIAELTDATHATQAQVAAARAELSELVEAALAEADAGAPEPGGTTYLRLAEPPAPPADPEPQWSPAIDPEPQSSPVIDPEPQWSPVIDPEPQWSPVIEPWTNVFLRQGKPHPAPQLHSAPAPAPAPARVRTRSGGLLGLLERRAR